MFKEQNLQLKCNKCEHKAKSISSLKRHVKSCHEEKNLNEKQINKFEFSCDKCEFKTKNKYTLKLHIQSCHKDDIFENKEQIITKKRKINDNTPKSGKKSKENLNLLNADIVSLV